MSGEAAEHVHETWEGVADGGPLAGETLHCWGPKGMLVVSEASERTWVYDYDPLAARFSCRDTGPIDPDKLIRAQEDGGRAIRVVE